jgi:CRP-like cAMP-binding protein
MTRDRDLPPFAALDCDVFNNSVWPSVRHNRQFFPKGAPIMSEGSLATGVWIITQGCAARTITAASGNARQQQLAVETLVPGQSVGWEELTLQLRPDFARQVNSPPSSPPSLPPSPPLVFQRTHSVTGALQAAVTNISSVVALTDVRTIFVPEKEIRDTCSSPEFLFVQVLFAQPVLAASALM